MRWTQNGGEAQRNLTRRRITEAARACFYAHGLNETSVDQIAKVAGIGRATLYLHFSNKEAIVGALLTSDLRGVRAIYGELCELKPLNKKSVSHWLKNYITTLQEHRDERHLFEVGLANARQSRDLIAEHHEAIIEDLSGHFPFLKGTGQVHARRYAFAMLVLARVDHFAGAAADDEPRLNVKAGFDIVVDELLALLQNKIGQ